MIRLREFTDADYPLAESWWSGHGVPVTPRQCLPQLGRIAEWNGEPVFAAWASMDNSCGVACLLWPVGNPSANPRAVAQCIPPLVDLLKTIVRELGYHTFLAITHRPSIARKLSRIGFTADREPVHVLFTTA